MTTKLNNLSNGINYLKELVDQAVKITNDQKKPEWRKQGQLKKVNLRIRRQGLVLKDLILDFRNSEESK